MDQKYWGKVRSASEEPPPIKEKEPINIAQTLLESGQKIVRSASKLAKSATKFAQRNQRSFSQPNADTLAAFEKVTTAVDSESFPLMNTVFSNCLATLLRLYGPFSVFVSVFFCLLL